MKLSKIAFSSLYACRLLAQQPLDVNPFENPNEVPKRYHNPNHLEPIRAYSPDGYEQRVFKHLIGTDMGELWMVTSGVDHERAVILRQTHELNGKVEWTLESVEATAPLKAPANGNGDPPQYRNSVSKPVRRNLVISKELASKLLEAWQTVLPATRYVENGKDYRGFDGTNYWFFCKPDYFGTTWSPEGGRPKLLVILALRLADLVSAPKEQTERLSIECVDLTKKIANANSQTK